MSAATDNAMTRFLFAILKQKNLKDIDWNKVAHDPVLSQEITNGHAARMRYSRFRSAMLGLEPQRRNRPTQGKTRVTKTKKEAKTKKEEGIKSETGESGDSKVNASIETLGPKIKPENSPNSLNSRLPPISGGPPTSLAQLPMQARLMTPCSDTDPFGNQHGMMAPSPTNDMFNSQQSFDFPTPFCGPEHAPWQHAPPPLYSPFEPPQDFDQFAMAYPTTHMQHAADMFGSQPVTDGSGEGGMVKHEDWDAHC